MKTRFKYIHFEVGARNPSTTVWICHNTKYGDILGSVSWYGPWRQYCFFPEHGIVFSAGCMADIQAFIQEAMADHNAKREERKLRAAGGVYGIKPGQGAARATQQEIQYD